MVTRIQSDAMEAQRVEGPPGPRNSSCGAGPWMNPVVERKSSRGTSMGDREGENRGSPQPARGMEQRWRWEGVSSKCKGSQTPGCGS